MAYGVHEAYNDFEIPEDLEKDRKDILSFLESKVSISSFIKISPDEPKNRVLQEETRKAEGNNWKDNPIFQPDTIKAFFIKEKSIERVLEMLSNFNGRSGHKVGLFENPILNERIEKLTNGEFSPSFMDSTIPISVESSQLYIEGMLEHSGGDPGAAMVIDLNKNKIFIGIRNNGQTRFYSEEPDFIPPQLLVWDKTKSNKN